MNETRSFPDYLLETAALARRKKSQFNYSPSADQLKVIAAELDLSDLQKVHFKGNISPAGRHDWQLSAELGATATQPCTITLAPVKTRVEAQVNRRFVKELPDYPNAKETEEDEFGGVAMLDDEVEPLGNEIDLWSVMIEALALELPDYPRAPGAELGAVNVTEPGKTALDEEAIKPFAGLAALRDKLESKE